MERVRGIEPPFEAWEAAALPLSYTRDDGSIIKAPLSCKWALSSLFSYELLFAFVTG